MREPIYKQFNLGSRRTRPPRYVTIQSNIFKPIKESASKSHLKIDQKDKYECVKTPYLKKAKAKIKRHKNKQKLTNKLVSTQNGSGNTTSKVQALTQILDDKWAEGQDQMSTFCHSNFKPSPPEFAFTYIKKLNIDSPKKFLRSQAHIAVQPSVTLADTEFSSDLRSNRFQEVQNKPLVEKLSETKSLLRRSNSQQQKSSTNSIIEYSGRPFTMYEEKKLEFMKFKEFARFKKRAFAPEMVEQCEAATAKKEEKKMMANLTASIKQFALSDNPLTLIDNLQLYWTKSDTLNQHKSSETRTSPDKQIDSPDRCSRKTPHQSKFVLSACKSQYLNIKSAQRITRSRGNSVAFRVINMPRGCKSKNLDQYF